MSTQLARHIRRNVVAYLALFFALSGSAVAAGALIRQGDSAGGALAGTYPNPTIAPNAVSSAQVGPDALTGADILEPSLGKVGDADTLDGQDSAAFLGRTEKAANSSLLDGTVSVATLDDPGVVHPVTVPEDDSITETRTCPSDGLIIRGRHHEEIQFGGPYSAEESYTRSSYSVKYTDAPSDGFPTKLAIDLAIRCLVADLP